MKRVLVTGAAGFLGYHLSVALRQGGAELTVCDDFSRGQSDFAFEGFCKQGNVKFLKVDLADAAALKKLEGPYDEVYHMAAVNGTRFFYEKPDYVLRTNLLSTINMLDWFVASGSKKFLFPSSSEAYAGTISLYGKPLPTPESVPLCIPDVFNPRFSYAGSKIAGELLVINYSRQRRFHANIVRYHNIYGPRMGDEHVVPNFIGRCLRKEDPFKIYGADQKRAFCYVSDACEMTTTLMESGKLSGEVAHIGNPREEIDVLGLGRMICDMAGFHPRFERHPAPEGSVPRRIPDTSKIEKALGIKAEVALKEGLKKTFDWYSKKG